MKQDETLTVDQLIESDFDTEVEEIECQENLAWGLINWGWIILND